MNSYTFKVKMSCYGCVRAVIKCLNEAGINKVDVNFDKQLVYVKTTKTSNDVLGLINSTGKTVVQCS